MNSASSGSSQPPIPRGSGTEVSATDRDTDQDAIVDDGFEVINGYTDTTLDSDLLVQVASCHPLCPAPCSNLLVHMDCLDTNMVIVRPSDLSPDDQRPSKFSKSDRTPAQQEMVELIQAAREKQTVIYM